MAKYSEEFKLKVVQFKWPLGYTLTAKKHVVTPQLKSWVRAYKEFGQMAYL